MRLGYGTLPPELLEPILGLCLMEAGCFRVCEWWSATLRKLLAGHENAYARQVSAFLRLALLCGEWGGYRRLLRVEGAKEFLHYRPDERRARLALGNEAPDEGLLTEFEVEWPLFELHNVLAFGGQVSGLEASVLGLEIGSEAQVGFTALPQENEPAAVPFPAQLAGHAEAAADSEGLLSLLLAEDLLAPPFPEQTGEADSVALPIPGESGLRVTQFPRGWDLTGRARTAYDFETVLHRLLGDGEELRVGELAHRAAAAVGLPEARMTWVSWAARRAQLERDRAQSRGSVSVEALHDDADWDDTRELLKSCMASGFLDGDDGDDPFWLPSSRSPRTANPES